MNETGCYVQPVISANAKQVTLTIDGKQVVVPFGSLLIQACEKAGSPVPFYCYHPGLSIAGNCRICMVEIIGAKKKLEISCNTQVEEGMVVKTTSDEVLKGRSGVLEYLLINHPLDCPVCDQAGECWLQDYYMQHGLYDPKFNEQKNKKSKKVVLGPTVMLDAERCILCSRCVRFTDEITKTGEFGIFNRGDHAEIGISPGKKLNNNYSGNVVDICPVGALTDRDFRFKCRVWYLGAAKSVCPGCSKGCNVDIHYNREREYRSHIAGGNRVMRLKPRYNADVNQWWMCDAGRYGYRFIDENRITRVTVKSSGGKHRETSWVEAFRVVVENIRQLHKSDKITQLGVILSSHQTNEDLYAAKRCFSALGKAHLAFQRPKPGDEDALLMRADKSPNARGAIALGIPEGAQRVLSLARKKQLKTLIIFTQDLVELFGEAIVKEAVTNLDLCVFVGTNRNRTAQLSDIVLPSAVYAEKDGSFTNIDGRIQRIHAAFAPMGDAKTELQILSDLAVKLNLGISFTDAETLFADMGRTEAAFSGLTYLALGDVGAQLTT